MQHLGWKSSGNTPVVFTNREGIDMNVFEMGPQLLKAQIQRDWHNLMAESSAAKHGLPAGERLDFEHTRKHLAATSGLTEKGASHCGKLSCRRFVGCPQTAQCRL